jgi:hypothetical protein
MPKLSMVPFETDMGWDINTEYGLVQIRVTAGDVKRTALTIEARTEVIAPRFAFCAELTVNNRQYTRWTEFDLLASERRFTSQNGFEVRFAQVPGGPLTCGWYNTSNAPVAKTSTIGKILARIERDVLAQIPTTGPWCGASIRRSLAAEYHRLDYMIDELTDQLRRAQDARAKVSAVINSAIGERTAVSLNV